MEWCAFNATSAVWQVRLLYPDTHLTTSILQCAQALALHGARVTLTDLPVCLELMRHNVAINFPDQPEGEQLQSFARHRNHACTLSRREQRWLCVSAATSVIVRA